MATDKERTLNSNAIKETASAAYDIHPSSRSRRRFKRNREGAS
jgi:hypothetical protein